MKKIFIFTVCFATLVTITGIAQSPNVFVLDEARLSEIKKKAIQKDPSVLSLAERLKKEADKQLSMKPMSVMDKAFTPVSGNKHDYMSQAPYFWYDSTKPNGLPYVRKDGVRNPEIYKITDRAYLGRLESSTRILALAWYLSGEEKYAEKASTLLRHWFLDEETRMNPHLEYAQAIPGINNGRGIGIIETRSLIGIADVAGLLAGSKSWTTDDNKSLQQWYASYLDWMLTSKNGNDEHAAKNNHGTWFYAQTIDFALFTGNLQKAKQLAEESRKRLDSQLLEDGRQPLELERTNALGYSTMNLGGWFTVATLAEKTGIDLWNYKTSKGASIRTCLSWLTPYATGEKKWAYQQISPYEKNDIYSLLLRASDKFNTKEYTTYANAMDKDVNEILIDLLYKH
jgi:hypothetical protein